MAKMPVIQGCQSLLVHNGHAWKTQVRGPRGPLEERWCPGRVRCIRCDKTVFMTLATQVPDFIKKWTCTRKCG